MVGSLWADAQGKKRISGDSGEDSHFHVRWKFDFCVLSFVLAFFLFSVIFSSGAQERLTVR
jgi:hypothetical protein